jgi:hypothetical protein
MSGGVLNEWEQQNISVLTSRQMGVWLARRESRLLDKIKEDIEKQADWYFEAGEDLRGGAVLEILTIIDKYRHEVEE